MSDNLKMLTFVFELKDFEFDDNRSQVQGQISITKKSGCKIFMIYMRRHIDNKSI